MAKRPEKHVIMDLFCGGGGTTTGVMMALAALNVPNSDVELIAVNHWSVAIDTHTANHPFATHHRANLAEIGDPCKLITSRKDRRVKLLWASPECTGHSRARGGKPANDQSRSSANLILDFLDKLHVETLMIENVREFIDWGPLGIDGRPLPSKRGVNFRHWLEGLKVRGYKYEYRVLNCADFGTPTTRQRFFLIAVKGNRPILWPEQTHAGPKAIGQSRFFGAPLKPWVPARDIIDWSDLGSDIFTGRKRPLADNTMERIRAGARRFWGVELDVAAAVHAKLLPVFVDLAAVLDRERDAWKRPESAIEFRLLDGFVGLPIRDGVSVESPRKSFSVDLHGTGTVRDIDMPVQTLAAQGNHVGVVSPLIAIAQPFLTPNFTGRDGQATRVHSIDDPATTVTGRGAGNLVSPLLVGIDQAGAGTRSVRSTDAPMPTAVTKQNQAVASPFLAVVNHGVNAGETQDRRVSSLDAPLATVTGSKGEALISPFLAEYYGTRNVCSVDQPVPTVTTVDRFALVTMRVDEVLAPDAFPVGAVVYRMQILFRMLRLAECARAQSFPHGYRWTGTAKEQQIQVGNAVPPQMAMSLTLPTLAHALGRSAQKQEVAYA